MKNISSYRAATIDEGDTADQAASVALANPVPLKYNAGLLASGLPNATA